MSFYFLIHHKIMKEIEISTLIICILSQWTDGKRGIKNLLSLFWFPVHRERPEFASKCALLDSISIPFHLLFNQCQSLPDFDINYYEFYPPVLLRVFGIFCTCIFPFKMILAKIIRRWKRIIFEIWAESGECDSNARVHLLPVHGHRLVA